LQEASRGDVRYWLAAGSCWKTDLGAFRPLAPPIGNSYSLREVEHCPLGLAQADTSTILIFLVQ
jgi:hypothetical protein